MLADIYIYSPLAFLVAVAVLALVLTALSRAVTSRKLHEQQKEAWKAYRQWADSGPAPVETGLPLAPPSGAQS